MAKYEMVSLSVQLGNRVVRKDKTPKIDSKNYPADEIKAAEKAGFIKAVKEPQANNSTKKVDAKPQTNSEKAKSNTGSGSGKSQTNK